MTNARRLSTSPSSSDCRATLCAWLVDPFRYISLWNIHKVLLTEVTRLASVAFFKSKLSRRLNPFDNMAKPCVLLDEPESKYSHQSDISAASSLAKKTICASSNSLPSIRRTGGIEAVMQSGCRYATMWVHAAIQSAHVHFSLIFEKPRKWPWCERHSWQSWRNRYCKDRDRFDLLVRKWLKRYDVEPGILPPATPSVRTRVQFSAQDDNFLEQYLAKYSISSQGRLGNKLYTTLVANVSQPPSCLECASLLSGETEVALGEAPSSFGLA